MTTIATSTTEMKTNASSITNDDADINTSKPPIPSPPPSSTKKPKEEEENNNKEQLSKEERSKRKRRKKRLREIEKEAALRTLNGDGCDLSLPPLPSSISEQQQQQNESQQQQQHSHPYGVLPHGNIYSLFLEGEDEKDNETFVLPRNQMGPYFTKCNDAQLITICSFLSGKELSRLVCCNRFCYVLGHLDELWRDLTLRKHNGGEEDIQWAEGGGGWKDTYVHGEILREKKNRSMNRESDHSTNGQEEKKEETTTPQSSSSSKKDVFVPHKPISINHIYSDTFYRPYLCRTFPLPKAVFTQQTVPTFQYNGEDNKNLSIKDFLQKYEEKNTPLLIKGATKSWPAFRKWKDVSYFEKQTQQKQGSIDDENKKITFRATSGAAPLPASFTLPSYLRYCNYTSYTEELPLYLFDRTFVKKVPQLEKDYREALWNSCPFWDSREEHHDLLGLLGEERRPDYRWLIIGPKRSGSSFHIDPNATHAWNAPLLGRKHWIFYPPGITPPGIYPSPSGDDVAMPISIGEWFLAYYTQHESQHRNHPDPAKRPLECIAEPGDILFVPHGWWHAVLNIDEGPSVALTQNYVSESNLSDVLRFFEYKQSQISGCRDRKEDEAIQPEHILEEFGKALKTERKEMWEKAFGEAKAGWKCCAWTDDVDDNGGKQCSSNCDGDESSINNNGKRVRNEAHDINKKKRGRSVLDRARMPEVSTTTKLADLTTKVADTDNKDVGTKINEKKKEEAQEGGFRFSFAF